MPVSTCFGSPKFYKTGPWEGAEQKEPDTKGAASQKLQGVEKLKAKPVN